MAGFRHFHHETVQCRLPTTAQLAWSDDGCLALDALEELHLWIPSVPEHNVRHQPFEYVRLNIRAFSEADWPLPEKLPMESMSLGEEQGETIVQSMAWCSGIAPHDRSALAILTSENFISIWAPGQQTQVANNWSRVLTISQNDLSKSSASFQHERRIRSFAWAPSLGAREASPSMQTLKHGVHPLIIGDDCETLHVLLISSSKQFGVTEWTFKEVAHYSLAKVTPFVKKPSTHSSSLSPIQLLLQSASQRSITSVSCSPWTMNGSSLQSDVAICKGGELFQALLSVDHQDDENATTDRHEQICIQFPPASNIYSDHPSIKCSLWQFGKATLLVRVIGDSIKLSAFEPGKMSETLVEVLPWASSTDLPISNESGNLSSRGPTMGSETTGVHICPRTSPDGSPEVTLNILTPTACRSLRLNYAVGVVSVVGDEFDQSFKGAIADVVSVLEGQNQQRRSQKPANLRWRGVANLGDIRAVCVLPVPTDGNELRSPPEEPAYIIFYTTKASIEEKVGFPWQNSMAVA